MQRVSNDFREQAVEDLIQEANRQRAALAAIALANSGTHGVAMHPATPAATTNTGERSLRSSGPSVAVEKPEPQNGNATTAKNDKSTNYAALLSGTKKRAAPFSVASLLDKCLGEEEMRSDFYSIVKDLEGRASNYVSRMKGKEPAVPFPVVSVDNNGRLLVGTSKYCIGDMVTVISSLSGESFSGVLVVVTNHEVSGCIKLTSEFCQLIFN
jgi:hypothetical protein